MVQLCEQLSLAAAAQSYLSAGLCVLPANLKAKRPAVISWKAYQSSKPSDDEVSQWFSDGCHKAMCIVAGIVSGNLQMLDFDSQAEAFEAWCELVEDEAPGLILRLVIERSQSGGKHVVYRLDVDVPGNEKLAEKLCIAPNGDEVIYKSKTYKPRKVGSRWEYYPGLVETRGQGGLFLCAPSPGYVLEQGQFEDLPVITDAEREILIRCARSLNEHIEAAPPPPGNPSIGGQRPGDEYNERGDVRDLLRRHGWMLVRGGDNEYWRRPGKSDSWSATLKNDVFYVHSTSAAPFEGSRAYGPFAVYTMLEHNGDYAAAAGALRMDGYGSDASCTPGINLSGITGPTAPDVTAAHRFEDPGPLPDDLLEIPGFVGEVMDHCLTTAPYPNRVLSFAGAIALQAFLAGRKVRDCGDNRTNIYLLGLAHSASGKDHPRKVNVRIMHESGLAECLGERFASGEGIQDRLLVSPSMIYQTDEIDGMLQSINKAKDARYESIMSTLLTMYSSANSVFPMRSKAGKETPGVIDQPSMVIFGTAIPNHYYEALSERMLTNGFFARMLIMEAGHRGKGQEPRICDLPQRVLETARWWADFQPGTGNLEKWHPIPAIVKHTDAARDLLIETREETEAQYDKAASANDAVGTTVWGRVSEHVRKLALLYAVSENHVAPRISPQAVGWASRFVMHQVRRMLFMASTHVADNPFHAECLKITRRLQEAPDGRMQRQHLLRFMHCKAADFDQMTNTLIQQGEIVLVETPTATKHAQSFQLAGVTA